MPKQELKGKRASFYYICSLCLVIFFIVVDQVAKYFIVEYINLHQLVGNRYFNLTHYKNSGIAFGIPFKEEVLLFLIVVLVGSLVWYYHKSRQGAVFIGLSLIIGGAFSNVIDRLFRGGVVDYISVFIWPTFNFADICITLGVLALAIHEFSRRDK